MRFSLLLVRMFLLEDFSFCCVAPRLSESESRARIRPPAPAWMGLHVVEARGPRGPVDEGSQCLHEVCSRVHPLDRAGLEIFCLLGRSCFVLVSTLL